MITLDWITYCIEREEYFFSQHADEERLNDSLTVAEIEESLLRGSILETYPEDKRGSSCLVVGFTQRGKPVHTVCGRSGDALLIITVYIPTPPKFITPFERGT